MIQTVLQWLRAHPALGGLTPEHLGPEPGAAGLFCRGLEVERRSADVLGREVLRLRLRFTLAVNGYGLAAPSAGSAEEAGPAALSREGLPAGELPAVPQQLLDLDAWAAATAPRLGALQTVSLTGGRQVSGSLGQLPRWEADLTFTFTQPR